LLAIPEKNEYPVSIGDLFMTKKTEREPGTIQYAWVSSAYMALALLALLKKEN
jgi:hypothetical protein